MDGLPEGKGQWRKCRYRPGKSAHQALAKANYRCRYYDWVVDLDIKGFFDNIDHDLLLNPRIRGWMNYYCRWSKWTTTWIWRVVNLKLIKWLKWNRRFNKKRAVQWLKSVYKTYPKLFAHWSLVHP